MVWLLIFMVFSFGLAATLVGRVQLLGAISRRNFHTFLRRDLFVAARWWSGWSTA
jgi:hypothetical protein